MNRGEGTKQRTIKGKEEAKGGGERRTGGLGGVRWGNKDKKGVGGVGGRWTRRYLNAWGRFDLEAGGGLCSPRGIKLTKKSE